MGTTRPHRSSLVTVAKNPVGCLNQILSNILPFERISPRFGLKIIPSLKLIWPLKNDSWNISFLLGWPIFRYYVSFRECKYLSCHHLAINPQPLRNVSKQQQLHGNSLATWLLIFKLSISIQLLLQVCT